MKTEDIKIGEEYFILVPMRIRVIETGIRTPDGKGGSRRAGVVGEDVVSGLKVATRCDRIKHPDEIPFHRVNLG